MEVTRRGFLATAGAGISSTLVLLTGSSQKAYGKTSKEFKIVRTIETTTICPYCAVGCGIIVHSRDNKVVNTEGDPEHPINEGTLCPKGASLYQLANNEKRLQKVLYRAANATEFQEKSWDWAAKAIANGSRRRGTNPLPRKTPRIRSSTARRRSRRWAARLWTTRNAGFTKPF